MDARHKKTIQKKKKKSAELKKRCYILYRLGRFFTQIGFLTELKIWQVLYLTDYLLISNFLPYMQLSTLWWGERTRLQHGNILKYAENRRACQSESGRTNPLSTKFILMSVISLYSFLSNKIDDVEFDEEQLFQHISEVIDREDMKVRKRLAEICRKGTQNSKENSFFLKKAHVQGR